MTSAPRLDAIVHGDLSEGVERLGDLLLAITLGALSGCRCQL
jgi:hypothetical protein